MAKTITLTLPHDLSEDEAKRRIVDGIADWRRRFPAAFSGATETWTGNRMDFTAAAMGQSIGGRVEVQPQNVRLEIDLPMILAMFAEKLRPQIEAEGRKLLSGPEKKKE